MAYALSAAQITELAGTPPTPGTTKHFALVLCCWSGIIRSCVLKSVGGQRPVFGGLAERTEGRNLRRLRCSKAARGKSTACLGSGDDANSLRPSASIGLPGRAKPCLVVCALGIHMLLRGRTRCR